MKRTAPILIMIALIMGTTNAFSQDESYYKKYFKERITELDPIEGIYSVSEEHEVYDKNIPLWSNNETVKYIIY